MPNRATPFVSVRSARCSAIMILIFGILFDLAASAYFGFKIYFSLTFLQGLSGMGGSVASGYWKLGYPILIGILSQVTGSVGICASNPRRLRDKCRTATLCIFSIVLIGFESYIIDEFKLPLSARIKDFKADACERIDCYVDLYSYGSFVFLAAVIIINCIWCVICCLGSLFCMPDEQPRAQNGVELPTTGQDMMMQETQPSMYNNPALQASTENLQGNAPMAYGSGPPNNPTMQGNMQMQGNVPMAHGSGFPINPTMQGNMQMQGNAPMAHGSGPPTNPTMQGNMQMQGNAPMACGSGSSLYPKIPENMQSMQGSATPMTQVTSGE